MTVNLFVRHLHRQLLLNVSLNRNRLLGPSPIRVSLGGTQDTQAPYQEVKLIIVRTTVSD